MSDSNIEAQEPYHLGIFLDAGFVSHFNFENETRINIQRLVKMLVAEDDKVEPFAVVKVPPGQVSQGLSNYLSYLEQAGFSITPYAESTQFKEVFWKTVSYEVIRNKFDVIILITDKLRSTDTVIVNNLEALVEVEIVGTTETIPYQFFFTEEDEERQIWNLKEILPSIQLTPLPV
jgi:hypothetical protein